MIECGQIKGAKMVFIFTKVAFFSSLLWDFLWFYYHVHSVLLKKRGLRVQHNFPMVIATSSYLFGFRKEVKHCLIKGQKSKFIFNPSYCSYCLTVHAAKRKGGCVSCRIKRCICWQSKFLIIFFVLLWYSVSEVSSREISWNFMDSWPRVNGCLEISSSPLGWEHKGLQEKDLSLICCAGEDLLPWKNEMLSIQFSWKSGIPKLACWQMPGNS